MIIEMRISGLNIFEKLIPKEESLEDPSFAAKYRGSVETEAMGRQSVKKVK